MTPNQLGDNESLQFRYKVDTNEYAICTTVFRLLIVMPGFSPMLRVGP